MQNFQKVLNLDESSKEHVGLKNSLEVDSSENIALIVSTRKVYYLGIRLDEIQEYRYLYIELEKDKKG